MSNDATNTEIRFLEEEKARLHHLYAESRTAEERQDAWDALGRVAAAIDTALSKLDAPPRPLELTAEESALLKVAVGHMMEQIDSRTPMHEDLAALAKKLK